ncbi:unnamed protein product [Parnassius mnemosyne]|uniref:RecQ-mediated genome instability protein 1 n=1 Tax=Parnassius mnemosyne TaxID=213953 RepID=A0AAV1KVD8_9NEOP
MTQQLLLVNSVRKYLASHHMFAVEEWLSGFVEYLMENDGSCRENDVQNLAKEQWLLNDLKEICPGSLPSNLKSQQKVTLNGRFVLQINACVDIGTPAYQQYLKLQKVNTENIEATTNFEEKISSHRMIKLYLTDGVQEVSAIEYRPMRNLSCDITPGCKMLVKGPIECRRGMFLLTESNIELLGGEVQELVDTNSLACLLSTKLSLPVAVCQNNTINTYRDTNATHAHHTTASIYDRNCPTTEPVFEEISKSEARVNNQVLDTFIEDDIDVDQLAAIEAQFTENPGKRPLIDNNSKPEKKAKINPNTVVNNIDEYPEDEDLIIEDEDYIKEMEARFDAQDSGVSDCINKAPIPLPQEPFVYIKQINELSVNEKSGKVFRVKGQIMKLLSKLTVGKDGWSLKCAIVDGTGSMDVDFTSDVLSKLVGFTPLEMNQIKKQMATKPELKEKTVSALQKAKERLQILYCIIELTMADGPKITQLIPFDGTHVDLLKKRQLSREF